MFHRAADRIVTSALEWSFILSIWVTPVVAGAGAFLTGLVLLPIARAIEWRPLSIAVQVCVAIILVFLAFIILAWVLGEVIKGHRRRLLDEMQSLRDLTWREFEYLAGELYRRMGYTITEKARQARMDEFHSDGDDGVDILATKGHERIAIQCKCWWRENIGVRAVRELLGAVTDQRATRGVFITGTGFTPEAKALAERNGIELIDGTTFERMTREYRKKSPARKRGSHSDSAAPTVPTGEARSFQSLAQEAATQALREDEGIMHEMFHGGTPWGKAMGAIESALPSRIAARDSATYHTLLKALDDIFGRGNWETSLRDNRSKPGQTRWIHLKQPQAISVPPEQIRRSKR